MYISVYVYLFKAYIYVVVKGKNICCVFDCIHFFCI